MKCDNKKDNQKLRLANLERLMYAQFTSSLHGVDLKILLLPFGNLRLIQSCTFLTFAQSFFLESRQNQKGPTPRRFDKDNVTHLNKPPRVGNASTNVKEDTTLIPTMANDQNVTPSAGTGAAAKLEYSLHMQVLLTFVEVRLFFHKIGRRFFFQFFKIDYVAIFRSLPSIKDVAFVAFIPFSIFSKKTPY